MKGKCIVIGSGLAGTLISNALAEAFDVTVLEVGPKNSTSYPEVNFVKKKLAEVNTFCHGAGGTTNRWHNGLIPIRTSDISDPTFRQLLHDARPFLDKAASALHFPKPFYSIEFEKLLLEVASIGEQIASFSDGIDCLVYPKKFAPLTIEPSVNAIYNVDTIDFVASGNRITSIYFSSGAKQQSANADVVIVAAGGFGTPKVLTNILSALGENHAGYDPCFVDHPMGFIGKFRFPQRLVGAVSKFALLDKGKYVSRNIVRLVSECGTYKGGVYFRPAITMDNRLAIYKYKSLLGGTRGIQRFRNALSPKLLHPDVVAEIVSHVFSVNVPTRTYSVLFIGEQRTKTNRVFYEDGRLNVDWTISEKEIAIYRKMIERFVDMLSGAAEESNVQTNLTPDWLWSAAHHSGSTLLGDQPAGVIDTDLRLKCSENVFVCDGSVIQEHSYANTGLTIGALALRLANHLAH